MGANRSSCFILNGGIIKGVQLEFGNLRGPQEHRQMVLPKLHLQIRPVVGRPEKVVVASGEKSVC
jgi:hypothetical protein